MSYPSYGPDLDGAGAGNNTYPFERRFSRPAWTCSGYLVSGHATIIGRLVDLRLAGPVANQPTGPGTRVTVALYG